MLNHTGQSPARWPGNKYLCCTFRSWGQKQKRKQMLPSKRWKSKVRMWDTAARHRSLHTGLTLKQQLFSEAERTSQSFTSRIARNLFACPQSYFQSVFYNGSPTVAANDYKRGVATKPQMKKSLHAVVVAMMKQHQEPLPRWAPVCHFRPAGSTSPAPGGPRPHVAEASRAGSHDKERERPH